MNQIEQATAIRGAMVQTTKTVGWHYVKLLADKVVKKSIQEALDEEDSDRGEAKRIKASALQKGFNDLFNAVEAVVAFDPKELSEDESTGFGEIEQEIEEVAQGK